MQLERALAKREAWERRRSANPGRVRLPPAGLAFVLKKRKCFVIVAGDEILSARVKDSSVTHNDEALPFFQTKA